MDPYKACWCQSGKKWKWCHKDREKTKPKLIGALIAEQAAELQKKYCSHPDAGLDCEGGIVRAHTIQRRGGLADIAEDGHVISVRAGAQAIFENEGAIVPKIVGVGSASTFKGFCKHHDASMFRPVEIGNPTLTKANAFLLSYRALAYEMYTKRAAKRCLAVQREMDLGTSFYVQAEIQQHLHLYGTGINRGLKDLDDWKASYDEAYRGENYDDFSFVGIMFAEVIPVVAAGGLHVEFDFAGRRLQVISRGDNDFEHLMFNLTTLNGVSVAVFGWWKGSADTANTLVDSFCSMPDGDKANAVVHLAFEHIENTFMRPSWWESLPSALKEAALRKVMSGSANLNHARTATSLRDRTPVFSNVGVAEIVR
jgi:hypothetical protein